MKQQILADGARRRVRIASASCAGGGAHRTPRLPAPGRSLRPFARFDEGDARKFSSANARCGGLALSALITLMPEKASLYHRPAWS
jgi:hypothetical protein